MLPSDNPRLICKQILFTAVDEMLISAPGSQLPKIIFFMPQIKDTISLRDDIHIWLKERDFQSTKRIVSSYHGDMPSATQKDIEQQFDTGQLRILTTTVAYALGVNPAGVKYVFQQGHCSTNEALQKLGRASWGARNVPGAAFIWVLEKRVVGSKMCNLPADEQQQLGPGHSRAKNSKSLYENIPV